MPNDIDRVAATEEHAAILHDAYAQVQEEVGRPEFPAADVARIRRVARNLHQRQASGALLSSHGARVRAAADIDLAPPTASRIPGASLLKRFLSRLVGWQVRHLGQQTAELARSVADSTSATATDVAALRIRLNELETEVERLASDSACVREHSDS